MQSSGGIVVTFIGIVAVGLVLIPMAFDFR